MGKRRIHPDQISFLEDIADAEPLRDIRSKESQLRSEIDLTSSGPATNNFPSLIFPQRWELLKAETDKRRIPIRPLIIPVQDGLVEIEKEKRHIEETGMGRLLILSGASGSGKTTFLNSLSLFIDGIDNVHSITMRAIDRPEVIEDKLASLQRSGKSLSIIVLEGKEAPGALRSDEIDVLLTTLNSDFRKDPGRKTLFVIPTTSQSVAQSISQRAADIGGMTSRYRPFYVFSGPPRSEYKIITDTTMRALNESRGLLDYGVTDVIARGIAESTESIGAFMMGCYEEIKRQQDGLKEAAVVVKRKTVHLWMVFCSYEEDNRRNHDLIRSLTSTNHQYVQVGRILAGDANEIKFWEGKEGTFGLAAQYLDLRISYIPLRTANAVVTAYGHRELVEKLKNVQLEDESGVAMKREAVRSAARESLAGTAVGFFLRKQEFVEKDISRRNRPTEKHRALFKEFMKLSNDKELNSMMASTMRDMLNHPDYKVATELAIDGTGHLIADIAVVTPTDIYCLEYKWRSSMLTESEIIRETVGRVREFATQLPELRAILGKLE